MLMLPHLLDAMKGKVKNADFHCLGDVDGEHLADTIALLESAEKFDFGDLHLEPNGKLHPTTKSKMYDLPRLTDVEREAWALGMIPSPSDLCWYEFTRP